MNTYDIFISYRRDGGEYTARILRDKLEELGYKVFFDVESLRSGDFNTKLYSVIDECKDFLLILSPGALDRCANQDDWVRCEIEHALQKGKNIVPVMLRGFSFPETLPDSINALRYKNGLEASSQFFDAFIDKLRGFLITKPPLVRRITQDSLFKRTLPVLIALILVAVVGTGVYFAVRAMSGVFPRTAAEKSVTSEVIYYIESHLTRLDQMAAAVDDAVKAIDRCLSGGSTEKTAMDDAVERAVRALEDCRPEDFAPEDGFLDRVGGLDGAPFLTADLIGMHDTVVMFRQEWTGYLRHLQWAAEPDTMLSDTARMTILDSYRTMLEEDLKAHAYNANELLLPITDRSSLKEFFGGYLPTLTRIPLSAANWSDDYDALEAEITACLNREEAALGALRTTVGNTNMENEALRATLIRDYMALGLSQEEAERLVEDLLGSAADPGPSADLLPAEGDDEEALWVKLARLVAARRYEDAESCVDALEPLVKGSDPYAAEYIPALRRFFLVAVPAEIDYGVMVVGQADESDPNEVYRTGDIIVMVGTETCRTYEEYLALKSALPEGPYTVTVVRAGADGTLGVEVLELDSGMPKVRMRTLSAVGYYE